MSVSSGITQLPFTHGFVLVGLFCALLQKEEGKKEGEQIWQTKSVYLHFCVADKKIKQRTVLTTGPGFVFLVDCSGAFSKRKLKLVIQWAFVTPT